VAQRKVLAAASINKDIPRMARMWKEIAELLDQEAEVSGRLSVEDITDKDAGGLYRAIRLRWREEIQKGWKAPTLHIDATVDIDLVLPYFPQAELRADIAAQAPHQRIVQHYDRTFSKSSMAHDDKAVDKLWAWVRAQAFQKGGTWLVVVQKVVEDAIRERFDKIPAFIDLAHHNNIAGRDRWKDVDHLVVVGRTQPRLQAVANIAGALTGRYVEDLDGDWYSARMETLRSKDGKVVTVEVDRHPDPMAERIRSTICEGEIVQIIGRGRGANRTAANPLEVIVLGDLPIGEQIDELLPWQGLGINDSLAATGGVWLSSIKHTAEAYGCHAKTVESDRAKQTEVDLKSRIGTSYTGFQGHLRQATYLRSGPGRKLATAIYDPRAVPDIRVWLVAKLGPMAEVSIDGDLVEETLPSTAETKPASHLVAPVILPLAATFSAPGKMDATEPEPAEYSSGIMPKDISIAIRDAYQDAGITQDRAAEMLGLSRPHLANALAGRYSLSAAKVEKLHAFLERPPPVVQPRLI